MRRVIVLLTVLLLSLGAVAGPAAAFEPPGEAAQDNFDCVLIDGEVEGLSPVKGHPGAAGLVGATPKVGELTEGTPAGETRPTAWTAVDNPGNIGDVCAEYE